MSGIKKGTVLLLILALLTACGALAEDTIHCSPGDSFDAVFTLVQNPNKAVAATLKLNYDHSVFELVPSGFAQNDGAFMLDLNGIAEGTTGTASFRVLSGAAEGEYSIALDVTEAGDINERFVTDMLFSTVTVRVGQEAEIAGPARKPNEYFSDGRLSVAYDYNEQGFLAWSTTYNRYGKVTRIWTALEFDDAGNAVKYRVSYPGNTGEYTEYTSEAAFDANGNEVSIYTVNKAGLFSDHVEKTYDQKNRITSITYYNEKGECTGYSDDFRYDDADHLISNTSRNADGTVKKYYKAEWNGNVRVVYTDTSPEGQVITRHTYDPIYGDQLTGMSVREDSTSEYTLTYGQDGFEEEYYSYDEGYGNFHAVSQYDTQGRCVKYVSLDENGNEDGTTYYEYGENGAYTTTYYSSYNSRFVEEYDEYGRNTVDWYYSQSGEYDTVTYYKFDERNRKASSEEYDLTGQLESTTVWEYDDQDREIRQVNYYADGKKSYENVTTYREDGKSTRVSTSYFSDGTYSVSDIDENGKTQKRSSYDKSGKLESYSLYEYNERGKTSRETKYDSKGNMTGYTVYQYNENGDYTERAEYDSSGSVKSRYVYEYDSQGRETKRTSYNEKGQISYQVLVRYDEDGTRHERMDFYSNGEKYKEGDWN